MKNFNQLKVWQKGMAIAKDCYELTKTFPKSERFELTSQITRAAVSIPSNIAEGSSRTSERDYRRFLEISLGSAFELETQLIAESANFGDSQVRNSVIKAVDEEQKMLLAFISKLKIS